MNSSARPSGAYLPSPPGGRSIPRLQELSFLEVAARAVSAGSTFEEVSPGQAIQPRSSWLSRTRSDMCATPRNP